MCYSRKSKNVKVIQTTTSPHRAKNLQMRDNPNTKTSLAALGEWTIDVVQNHKMQRALLTFLDTSQPDDARIKAARAVLRDGSRHGVILLCEAMSHLSSTDFFLELTPGTLEAFARHPLHSLHGVLRVKSLKLLKDPSSHHGRDHLSALRWLVHVCTPEDIPLFLELLRQAYEDGDASLHEELYKLLVQGARVLWLTSHRELQEASLWRALIHALLFEVVPATQPTLTPLLDTLLFADAPEWYEAALLYGVQLRANDLPRQAELLSSLVSLRPERHDTLAAAFVTQREQQPQRWRYTNATQQLQRHIIDIAQQANRRGHVATVIQQHEDHEGLDELAATLTASRIEDDALRTLIAHALLPYASTFSDDLTRQRRLLDALWNLALSPEHLPLLWHQAHALQTPELQLLALRLMSLSLLRVQERFVAGHAPLQQPAACLKEWRERVFRATLTHLEQMRELWQTGAHDETELHHTGFLILEILAMLLSDRDAGELYTSMWDWLLEAALAAPNPAPTHLAEIIQEMLEKNLIHHLDTIATPAWQARFQLAHDRMKHDERTMLALRQALRHLKARM